MPGLLHIREQRLSQLLHTVRQILFAAVSSFDCAERRTNRPVHRTYGLVADREIAEGDGWLYEVKFDGYRALAIKSDVAVRLRSRNDKDFTKRYPGVVAALSELPDETVIEGEVVALDATGKPAFSLLQNGAADVHFYVFDLLVLSGKI